MKGKQKRVKVYQNGKLIKTYETIIAASNAHFPHKYAEYLNDVFRRTNGVFSFGGLTFIKTNEIGTSDRYKKYIVHDRKSDRKFAVLGTGELLKIVNYGHNNVFRQFKVYGNYQDNQYSVWRI